MWMDIAIIIPVRNEGEWLNTTIRAIASSHVSSKYHIVVVDDGSTDGSVKCLDHTSLITTISTGPKSRGLIYAKNLGLNQATSRYVCFMDGHMIAHDGWLDYLRETLDELGGKALVSGNIPDVAYMGLAPHGAMPRQQYSYTLRNRMLDTQWYLHSGCFRNSPYYQPLTPGGLMFAEREYLQQLGGFAEELRMWGGEDVELSLRNYCMGGSNIVDPRVSIYHYFRDSSFVGWASKMDLAYNSLYIATRYLPAEYYKATKRSVVRRWLGTPSIVREIESLKHQRRATELISQFTRGWAEWTSDFPDELAGFMSDMSSHL